MHTFLLALGFGIVSASIIGISSVGFTMQFGISRIFNVSYGAIMTLCAYMAYTVDIQLHTNLWVGMAVGGFTGIVVSVAFEEYLFRPFRSRGAKLFTLVMVTLALDLLIQNVITMVAGSGFYTYQIKPEHIYSLLGMEFTSLQFVLILIGVIGMVGVHLLLRRTQLGRAMRATAVDPTLASCVGINVRRIATVTWGVSGLFCGLGGVALAINTAAFQPTTGDTFAFVVFAAAVVGGLGQPYGAMLGGLLVGVLSQEFGMHWPALEYVAVFALLVVVLVVRPAGIVRFGGRTRRDVAAA